MRSGFKDFFLRVKDFLERLLALKVTESERVTYAAYGFDYGSFSDRRPTQVAVVAALLFHVLLSSSFFRRGESACFTLLNRFWC